MPGTAFNPGAWAWKARVTTEAALANTLIAGDITTAGQMRLWRIPVALMPIEFRDLDGANPALVNGADVRASADDLGEVELPCSVSASFVLNNDPALSRGLIYVRQDLRASASDQIYIWFNNATAIAYDATEVNGRNAVFNGFDAYWDWEQSYGNAAPQFTDLTGNGYSATAYKFSGTSQVDFLSGLGFGTTTDTNIQARIPGSVYTGVTKVFINTIVTHPDVSPTSDVAHWVFGGGAELGEVGALRLRLRNNDGVRFYYEAASRILSTALINCATPRMIGILADVAGSQVRFYTDGDFVSSSAVTYPTPLTKSLIFSQGFESATLSNSLNGTTGEAFVHRNREPTAAELKTYHKMATQPGNFFSFYPVEQSALQRTVRVTLPTDEVGFKLAIYKVSDGALIDEIASSINAIEDLQYSILDPYDIRFVALKPGWVPVDTILTATVDGLQIPRAVFARDYFYDSALATSVTEGVDFSIDFPLKEISVLTPISLQTLHSALTKGFFDVAGRLAYPIPTRVNLRTRSLGFQLWDGWRLDSSTSINNIIADAGLTEYSDQGETETRVFIGLDTLNDISSTVQLYYQDSAGGVATNFPGSGRVRSLVLVKDSGVLLDNTAYSLRVFQREFDADFIATFDTSAIADLYPLPMVGRLYPLPIAADANTNIDPSEVSAIATWSDITITGATTFDFDEDSIAESWDINVDGAGRTSAQVAKRLQYLVSRGQAGLIDGVEGQLYLRADPAYSIAQAGPLARIAGSTVVGARGVLIRNVSDPVNLSLVDSGGTTRIAPVSVTATFNVTFRGGTPPANYEWRLYQDDPTPGILGTIELAGAENETSTTVIYNYQHTSDVAAIFQVIPTGFLEVNTAITLSNANQSFNITSDFDPNL